LGNIIINVVLASTYLDKTGLGEYIVEDARNAGIPNVEDITLTEPRKEEIATALKQTMRNRRLYFPFDENLMNELHNERFQLTKTERTQLNHPPPKHPLRQILGTSPSSLRTNRKENTIQIPADGKKRPKNNRRSKHEKNKQIMNKLTSQTQKEVSTDPVKFSKRLYKELVGCS
jgi:hypothetical protein